jgi:hypothetical protein
VTEWLIAGAFLAVILGLFTVEVFQNYRPAKLSALLVFLFWIPLLALHESGHAVASYLLGWRVQQVVIGMGKVMGQCQVGSANVEIRLFPVEGFVRSVPRKLRLPRVENALIYFAGPGVELLLALGVLLLVGPDRLLSASEEYGVILWQSLALAAAVQAVLNLLPFAIQTSERTIHSDGLGIILSFLRPSSYYAQMVGQESDYQQQEGETYDPADWWKRTQ